MTESEFDKQQSELLDRLPAEFRAMASWHAWEEGHSGGREEVLSCLGVLVYSLEEPIKAYTARLKEERGS